MFQIISVAVIFLGISQLLRAQENSDCDYPTCVFHGLPKRSGLEHIFVNFNFDRLTDHSPEQCQNQFSQRYTLCTPYYSGCPTEVTQDYSNRFDDPAYVHFIMSLGLYVCDHTAEFMHLKDHLTPEIQVSLQECKTKSSHDFDCIRGRYSLLDSCPDARNTFVALVENWLTRNPYETSW